MLNGSHGSSSRRLRPAAAAVQTPAARIAATMSARIARIRFVTDTYLNWVIGQTRTKWWHDSAEEVELDTGLERGAIGVTTNPLLANAALNKNRAVWSAAIDAVLEEARARNLPPEAKAEALMRIAVTRAAEKLRPEYESSRGQSGFVCAQVNPLRAGDREYMHAMAKRLHAWAPNIAVKLPATAA